MDAAVINNSVLDKLDAVDLDAVSGVGKLVCEKVDPGIKVGLDDLVDDVDCKQVDSIDDGGVAGEESLVEAVGLRDREGRSTAEYVGVVVGERRQLPSEVS